MKRTRPDRRLGEVVSIHDATRRSPYGANGPPVSSNNSFYFHHTDPDFERILPQVDRLRYKSTQDPASQPGSNDEIPDSQENTRPTLSTLSGTVIAHDDTLHQLPKSPSPANINREGTHTTEASQLSQKLHQTGQSEGEASKKSPTISTPLQTKATTTSSGPKPLPVPVITITSPDSKPKCAAGYYETPVVQNPILSQAIIAITLPDPRTTLEKSPESILAPAPYSPPPSDTQDTVTSTQHSEVFSPPVDFVDFTPPSQESPDKAFSQIDTVDHLEPVSAISTKAEVLRQSSDEMVTAPASSKRMRDVQDLADEIPRIKRSRLAR